MGYVREQLVLQSSAIVAICVLEIVYTFYLGRSVLLLFLHGYLLLSVTLLNSLVNLQDAATTGSARGESEQTAGDEPASPFSMLQLTQATLGSPVQRRAANPGHRLGGRGNAAPAANYRGTESRRAAPRATAPPTPPAGAAPSAPAAAEVSSIESSANSLALEDTAALRGEQIEHCRNNALLFFFIALLFHVVYPWALRRSFAGWTGLVRWHANGELSSSSSSNTTASTHAVDTAFARDYVSWEQWLITGKFYMDFLAVEEPPLLLQSLLGCPNSPAFLVLLDILLLLAELLLLKMLTAEEEEVGVLLAVSPDTPADGEEPQQTRAPTEDKSAVGRAPSAREDDGTRGADGKDAKGSGSSAIAPSSAQAEPYGGLDDTEEPTVVVPVWQRQPREPADEGAGDVQVDKRSADIAMTTKEVPAIGSPSPSLNDRYSTAPAAPSPPASSALSSTMVRRKRLCVGSASNELAGSSAPDSIHEKDSEGAAREADALLALPMWMHEGLISGDRRSCTARLEALCLRMTGRRQRTSASTSTSSTVAYTADGARAPAAAQDGSVRAPWPSSQCARLRQRVVATLQCVKRVALDGWTWSVIVVEANPDVYVELQSSKSRRAVSRNARKRRDHAV